VVLAFWVKILEKKEEREIIFTVYSEISD